MEHRVVELPELHLLGQRIVGKPGELSKLVPKGWRELHSRLPSIEGVLEPSVQFGFLLPKEHLMPLGRIATFISVRVDPSVEAPKGLRRHSLPASSYAEFTYEGSFLDPAFKEFYPRMFAAIRDDAIPFDATRGWLERYEDATHDWDDKTRPDNRIAVLFPLA